jgi:hypothetical protein
MSSNYVLDVTKEIILEGKTVQAGKPSVLVV